MKLKYLFLFLSFALTLVSLTSGFHLYFTFFGLMLAILMVSVFEVLRLSTLYSLNYFKGFYRALSILLYVLVSGICFIASTVSFDARILEKIDDYEKTQYTEIFREEHNIKRLFSQQIETRINELKTKIDGFNQKLSQNPRSTYYPQRITQTNEEIDALEEQRAKFFAAIDSVTDIEEKRRFIFNERAKLGMEDSVVWENKYSPYQRAAADLLGISETKLQSFIGYALGICVELGIILLALIGFSFGRKKEKDIINDYQEEEIEDPLEIHKPYNEQRQEKRREKRRQMREQAALPEEVNFVHTEEEKKKLAIKRKGD